MKTAIEKIISNKKLEASELMDNDKQMRKKKKKRHTLEKQAPICTLGVGGNPLLRGLGGVCLFFSLLRGGTGGVSDIRSGPSTSTKPVTSISNYIFRVLQLILTSIYLKL